MPFAINRGQRIHYTVEGNGPLVIFQHGLLLDAESWKQAGIVHALTNSFRVACIDSLGHGFSDKPSDAHLYGQEQRSGDIVAVMDHLECERAHLVGHSMGGWMAVGVAKHYPKRMLSMVVGGWHPVDGLPSGPNGRPVTFDGFMKFARRTTPTLVDWVAPEFEAGLAACFEALGELQGALDALMNTAIPILIWDGRDDPHYNSKMLFADDHGFQFLSTPGDHLGMVFHHGLVSADGIRAFLNKTGRDET